MKSQNSESRRRINPSSQWQQETKENQFESHSKIANERNQTYLKKSKANENSMKLKR